jgi:hypothetical protein
MKALGTVLASVAVVAVMVVVCQGSYFLYLVALGFSMWIAGPLVLACSIKLVVDNWSGWNMKGSGAITGILKAILISLAVLWGSLYLGKPLAARRVDTALAYASELLPQLDSYHSQTGGYPESLATITSQPSPKNLRYCGQAESFEITIKDPRIPSRRWYSSQMGQWRVGRYYGECW